jgi:hypothetical protein
LIQAESCNRTDCDYDALKTDATSTVRIEAFASLGTPHGQRLTHIWSASNVTAKRSQDFLRVIPKGMSLPVRLPKAARRACQLPAVRRKPSGRSQRYRADSLTEVRVVAANDASIPVLWTKT